MEEKLREEKLDKEVKDLTVPHLTNLNEDPLLSGKIYHNLTTKEKFLIGRTGKGEEDSQPDIILRGIGIQKKHAIIEKRGEEYFLLPGSEDASNFLILNCEKVFEEQKLHNWDRIVLGFNSIFIFKNKKENTPPRGFADESEIDWERVQMEI